MKERFYRKLDMYMMMFSKWFASPQGVLETFIVTSIWTILEFVFPHLDPNGFKFLYICTVWSVQTQNVLAYAATMSATEAQKNQDLLVQLSKNSIDIMEAIFALMKNQEEQMNNQSKQIENQGKQMEKLNRILNSIADDVEQIQEEMDDENKS